MISGILLYHPWVCKRYHARWDDVLIQCNVWPPMTAITQESANSLCIGHPSSLSFLQKEIFSTTVKQSIRDAVVIFASFFLWQVTPSLFGKKISKRGGFPTTLTYISCSIRPKTSVFASPGPIGDILLTIVGQATAQYTYMLTSYSSLGPILRWGFRVALRVRVASLWQADHLTWIWMLSIVK